MPSQPKPKQFVVTRPFFWNGRAFVEGDEIPSGSRTLAHLLRFGDKFVTEKKARKAFPQSTQMPSEED